MKFNLNFLSKSKTRARIQSWVIWSLMMTYPLPTAWSQGKNLESEIISMAEAAQIELGALLRAREETRRKNTIRSTPELSEELGARTLALAEMESQARVYRILIESGATTETKLKTFGKNIPKSIERAESSLKSLQTQISGSTDQAQILLLINEQRDTEQRLQDLKTAQAVIPALLTQLGGQAPSLLVLGNQDSPRQAGEMAKRAPAVLPGSIQYESFSKDDGNSNSTIFGNGF